MEFVARDSERSLEVSRCVDIERCKNGRAEAGDDCWCMYMECI